MAGNVGFWCLLVLERRGSRAVQHHSGGGPDGMGREGRARGFSALVTVPINAAYPLVSSSSKTSLAATTLAE